MRFTYFPRRWLTAAAAVAAAAGLSGCITMKSYVDPSQSGLTASQLPAVQDPQPVTVLFQFLSNGKPNASATGVLKPRVLSAVTASRMFSRVSTTADSAQPNLLKVVIDDQGDVKKGEEKGFGTGLTFGLVGTMVSDNYVCTASYVAAGKTAQATSRDTLWSTVGNHAAPPGLTPVKTPLDGVKQISDQLVWHSLAQLDGEGAFGGAHP
jgi:hypothetical protein